MAISQAERDFIIKGVQNNIRGDGRSCMDERDVTLETGVLPQASGSCLIRIQGGSHIVVGIGAHIKSVGNQLDAEELADEEQIGESESRKEGGRVECFVEYSKPAFNATDYRKMESMSNQLSQILNRTLNSHGLDLKSLGIIPGETCWVLRVDVLILEFGGSILDCITIAVRAALLDTLIPKTTIEEVDGSYDFEIGDEEICSLKGAKDVPISITINQLGSSNVIDASIIEEECASARLFVMVSADGKLCGMQKSGNGIIEPKLLIEMVENARKIGEKRLQVLDSFLNDEAAMKNTENYETIGFISI